MQLLSVQPPANHGLVACDLVGAIGRSNFGDKLLQSLRSTLRPDLISLFLYTDERPILLSHRTITRPFDEQKAIRSYMSEHFREDPAAELILGHSAKREMTALYMTRAEVPTISYRRQCYEEAHIADRFTVVGWTNTNEAVSINLYRDERSGPMEKDCLVEALALAPVLCASMVRHCELSLARETRDPRRILLQLIDRFPTLTRRESQCAADAIAGQTAEDSAGKFGIKITSVITHRKRAYERLNVTNLRELTSLYSAGS